MVTSVVQLGWVLWNTPTFFLGGQGGPSALTFRIYAPYIYTNTIIFAGTFVVNAKHDRLENTVVDRKKSGRS